MIAVIAAAGAAYWRYRYPHGWSHCCDTVLAFALIQYADEHQSWFPRGEESPEASLSLLYRQDRNLLQTLRGKTVDESIVRSRLEAGQLLTPDTCGWHYVEGLRQDDDPRLALFWDKAGLGHNGERLPAGGHYVAHVSGAVDYIRAAEWEAFMEEQQQLHSSLVR